jgi:hypothetical protein
VKEMVFLFQNVQSRPNLKPIRSTGELPHNVNRSRHEAEYPSPSGDEVMKGWSYTFIIHTSRRDLY